jgi:hypothetical protein
MAEGRQGGRWSRRSKTTALLAAGAVGAVILGLVWITGGDGRASGRAGGDANADTGAESQARGQPVRWDGARLVRGSPSG